MLRQLQKLVDQICHDCEIGSLEPEEITYLEQLRGPDQLGNFVDNGDGSMIALAVDAAHTFKLSRNEVHALEESWQIRQIVEQSQPQAAEHSYDFSSSGLGIGGLSHYEEPVIVPTVAQIERYERKMATAITCRRCGQNDVYGGAMFTTGGGDICDDCF